MAASCGNFRPTEADCESNGWDTHKEPWRPTGTTPIAFENVLATLSRTVTDREKTCDRSRPLSRVVHATRSNALDTPGKPPETERVNSLEIIALRSTLSW